MGKLHWTLINTQSNRIFAMKNTGFNVAKKQKLFFQINFTATLNTFSFKINFASGRNCCFSTQHFLDKKSYNNFLG